MILGTPLSIIEWECVLVLYLYTIFWSLNKVLLKWMANINLWILKPNKLVTPINEGYIGNEGIIWG